LIDSGANKNLIQPGVLKTKKEIKQIEITNIVGKQIIDTCGKTNLLYKEIPSQKYYELKFHNFFDGLIGSQFLAENEAILNYRKQTLEISKVIMPFEKYFPNEKNYNHVVTLPTNTDGEWIVYEPTKLCKKITVQPGVYSAKNKKNYNFTTDK